jgi:hypothetical protein
MATTHGAAEAGGRAKSPDSEELRRWRKDPFLDIAGTFDSIGPCIRADPNRVFILPGAGVDPGNFEEFDRSAKLSLQIPLWYRDFSQIGTTALVLASPDAIADGGTFAHEAHHLFNLCSCPVGALLHISQMFVYLICANLVRTLTEAGELNRAMVPFVGVTAGGGEAAALIWTNVEDAIVPMWRLQRALHGLLHAPVTDAEFTTNPHDINPLIAAYATFDRLAGTEFSRYLKGLDWEESPFVAVKSRDIHSVMGVIQLAESLARWGEINWYRYNAVLFQNNEPITTALQNAFADCFSGDAEYTRRYKVSELVASSVAPDCGGGISLFAAWMAMLSPIDPRTIHFVQSHKLKWRDIDPGRRFLRILETCVELKIVIGDDLSDFMAVRSQVAVLHDRIARELHWPDFAELRSAMGKADPFVERIFEWADDPFWRIFRQINNAREVNPWCDVMPSDELFHNNKILAPLAMERGILRMSSDPVGVFGARLYTFGHICEYLLVGGAPPGHKAFDAGDISDRVGEALFGDVSAGWFGCPPELLRDVLNR